MDIKFRKKAILFSLMSILFSILFVTIFSTNFTTTYEDRIPSSNIRVKVMDTYTKNLETYISGSIKTSTYRALDEITKYRYVNGGFFKNFSDFNNTFSNCMVCGHINCSNMLSANCSIGNSKDKYYLISKLEDVKNISLDKMNIKMEYKINSVEITQDTQENPRHDPFSIQVAVNISYNVTDNAGGNYYATWNKEKVISQAVTIIGLLDPTGYLSDSTHDNNRTITQYQGSCAFDESCWNPVTTEQFYNESSFRYYSNGISFLQRYWNDNTPSYYYGLETILHPTDIPGINLTNSYIDNYYWNNDHTCASGKTILTMTLGSDTVHLDTTTAARYNVTNLGTGYCP